ncbi:hypothetical protein NP233_g4991 [Leucocoprinus birnbaumii]|uniref:Uncharacterized protein n=1 Tax=Leucocoprinus birnbaumii TaxID=56174 RepID=A0AAD5VTR2_9AGAR|nr:hypothetical protein NP233_g4991 [Leucocoprinus birnbaumii]
MNGDPGVLPRPITVLKVPATSEELLMNLTKVQIALNLGDAASPDAFDPISLSEMDSYVKTTVTQPYDLELISGISCQAPKRELLNSPRTWWLTVNCSGINDLMLETGAVGLGVDIVVTVNFIGNFTKHNPPLPVLPSPVAAYISITDSWDDVIAYTTPVIIFRNKHLWATSSYWVKEKFVSNALAAMGISRVKLIYHVMTTTAKMLTQAIPPAPSVLVDGADQDTATFRITLPSYLNTSYLVPDIQIERDYYQDTMLTGFALLGGIWTFVNGLFAAIFGSTLLLVLFGIKPLSIYGLVHFFQRQRGKLVTRSDVSSQEEQFRVVGLLRDHLLDVDPISVEGNHGPNSDSDTACPPPHTKSFPSFHNSSDPEDLEAGYLIEKKSSENLRVQQD